MKKSYSKNIESKIMKIQCLVRGNNYRNTFNIKNKFIYFQTKSNKNIKNNLYLKIKVKSNEDLKKIIRIQRAFKAKKFRRLFNIIIEYIANQNLN